MQEATRVPYDYQERDISIIIEALKDKPTSRLLYRLPTGGGKTMVFTEIAKRFMAESEKNVVVLTHRKELLKQTARTLQKSNVKNFTIDSDAKPVGRKFKGCIVAMVETLRNRLRESETALCDVGLIIIDEAHHNSFRKLLKYFPQAHVVGVTATPLSSDPSRPLNAIYEKLILGENAGALIAAGFLAKPKTYHPDVETDSLKVGTGGDFSVSTSDKLYSSNAMLHLLLDSYYTCSKGKKTLIFNNGVATSLRVQTFFEENGIVAKHLDHKTSAEERAEILQWFKKTKGAVLTSVSLLTTGFDEPGIQSVILNRATNSLTLYHQMVGRGSRRMPRKKTFTVIDLGNNAERFGYWDEPLDWQDIFENPATFQEKILSMCTGAVHAMPSDLRIKFGNSLVMSFNINEAYDAALVSGEKPQTVIRDSIRQHARMCIENSESTSGALLLSETLEKEILWRIKQYATCIGKATKNYRDWLAEDYKRRLRALITKVNARQVRLATAS